MSYTDWQSVQNYGPLFADYYNRNAASYASEIAPRIRSYYESEFPVPIKSLLDIGCGTGQLALHFLKHDYRVLGVDSSRYMVNCAYQNTAEYIEKGLAEFVQANASNYSTEQQFGLAVSTNDTLNHFTSAQALCSCFDLVANSLVEGGFFIFDLNTKYGLTNGWNKTTIINTSDTVVVNRKFYDGGEKALAHVTGFLRNLDGSYDRFEEHFHNMVFEMKWIKACLSERGFSRIRFAAVDDLIKDIEDPEQLLRTMIIARK